MVKVKVQVAGDNIFKFKRFAVDQTGCAMKVGTDGVLLGAWCRIDPSAHEVILDIGTGTGLIAMMLAQRTEASETARRDCSIDQAAGMIGQNAASIGTTIEAVEIDPAACDCAERNFRHSPWSHRLKLHRMSIREFALAESLDPPPIHCMSGEYVAIQGLNPTSNSSARFDHVVSNPPWFVDSLTSPDEARTTARHTGALSYEELIALSDRLLKPTGRISLIIPADSCGGAGSANRVAGTSRVGGGGGVGGATARMIAVAEARGFVVSRRTEVHSTPKSGPKRTLLEFSRRSTPADTATFNPETLTIEVAAAATATATTAAAAIARFSAEYRALTSDFYLYF